MRGTENKYIEFQWLYHLWEHGNLFEIWVVQATEDYSLHQVRKQWQQLNLLNLLHNNGMVTVLNEAVLMSIYKFHDKRTKVP